MNKCLLAISGMILVAVLVAGAAKAADAPDAVVVNETFDNWEWIPLVPSTARTLRQQMEETGDTHFLELRGPVVRQPIGYALFANGRMVDGRKPAAGQAIHFKTDKIRYQIGLHGPFSHRLKIGHTFQYDVWLKGQGRFLVRVWLSGMEAATMVKKVIGAPAVINQAVNTNVWTRFEGSFVLARERPEFVYSREHSFAIIIEPGTDLHVDDFRIIEMGEIK